MLKNIRDSEKEPSTKLLEELFLSPSLTADNSASPDFSRTLGGGQVSFARHYARIVTTFVGQGLSHTPKGQRLRPIFGCMQA